MMKDNATRLTKLEDQLQRVGDIMGFNDLEEAVERCLAQQDAISRMKQLSDEARARVAELTERKAQMEIRFEEQLGGVDSEVTAAT